MTVADGLTVVTLVFPDPRSLITSSGPSFRELNSSMSFRHDQQGDIVSLSTTNTDSNTEITGLLYVPELDPGSTCEEVIFQYVPRNATSNLHLPSNSQYAFLAIAPWISATCTDQWLYAARDDPLRAFIFFIPDNKTTVPSAKDSVWSLNDNGRWKKDHKFPVYAISGFNGALILQNLARYSGNLTNVPFGQDLANEFPPNAYVRLAGSVSMDGTNALPSLWAFLLIVLGILIFIIASTSCLMHCIQRRRRASLRRRVANGEVDLERLGIKRLTVPKSLLDKMPLYTYPASEKEGSIDQQTASTKEADDSATQTSPPLSPAHPYKSLRSQPTCAICLEDFIPGDSTVRQLPCYHLFHPECVDTFLRENSSLCPLCKKTSLPQGYCPAVLTNAMVRRERMLRRVRERMPSHGDASLTPVRTWNPMTWQIWTRNVFSPPRRQIQSTHQSRHSTIQTHQNPSASNSLPQRLSPPPPMAGGSRSEWARRRALAMVGRGSGNSSIEEIEAEQRRRPLWRRGIGKIWPGLV